MGILTMEPVLRRGRSILDRQLLPGDELEGRLGRLLDIAADRGLQAVMVFGSAHHPENIGYLTNHIPTTFFSVLVATKGKPPILLAGKGGARDHPYVRSTTWVEDVRYYPEFGPGLVEILQEWGISDARVGVVGLEDALPHTMHDSVTTSLAPGSWDSLDAAVVGLRRRKSSRELAVLGQAEELARRACDAALETLAAGGTRGAALGAAEYVARSGGAHDCRMLVTAADGTLVPQFEVDETSEPFSGLVCVELLGYWGVSAFAAPVAGAEGSGTEGTGDLDALVAVLRPGMSLEEVAATLEGSHPTEGYRLSIAGLGYALGEEPRWPEDPAGLLQEGDVLNLMLVHPRRGISARTVALETDGARGV